MRAGLALLLLSACTHLPSPAERVAAADALAAGHGWQASRIDAAPFELQAYLPAEIRPRARLTIYVEGDGFAWLSPSQPSTDPTPRNPMALRLALADPDDNVAYLGRPCQFIDARRSGCEPKYWTGSRFAPEVVAATAHAVEVLKQKFSARTVRLVGYSGGGAVAALVAAQRQDVDALLTVAGNLDHVAWTEHHRVLPLRGSLNPADEADALRRIPQSHFVGAEDRVVPPAMAERYAARFPATQRPRIVVVAAQGHDCCWADVWPDLLREAR